jgi:serine/threonine protein phosphatase PrpC
LPDDIDERVELITQALRTVNVEMRKLSESHADYAGLGSTVTVLVVAGSESAIVWAGDTRVYRKRGYGLEHLNTDHSERQEMVERGDVLLGRAKDNATALIVDAVADIAARVAHEIVLAATIRKQRSLWPIERS